MNSKLSYKIKIVDDFLNEDDFNELCNLKIEKKSDEKFKIFHNEISGNEILKSSIDEKLLIKLNKYHLKAMEILKELSPEKFNLYDYSDFVLILTDKNAKFPFHDDTPNKLLSGVIYLTPGKNSGTVFSNNRKGTNSEKVDWKQNRAVFFSRKERETWHAYEGDGVSNRLALVYNLNSNRLKEVYKAENKNYFYGNLRYKLNPYLYQYLKFTI
tara:strand:- start:131 stop:769 length:639 start_codon:yes stop_codon:yes gene_type:complete